MVPLGSPRTKRLSDTSDYYPFALSFVEGLLVVSTQSLAIMDNSPLLRITLQGSTPGREGWD
jgi:hypothetical protein